MSVALSAVLMLTNVAAPSGRVDGHSATTTPHATTKSTFIYESAGSSLFVVMFCGGYAFVDVEHRTQLVIGQRGRRWDGNGSGRRLRRSGWRDALEHGLEVGGMDRCGRRFCRSRSAGGRCGSGGGTFYFLPRCRLKSSLETGSARERRTLRLCRTRRDRSGLRH